MAGVKSLTLYDPHPVEIADLSSQYFLQEADVGKRRDEVTAPRLGELNAYTPVLVHQKDIFDDISALSRFKTVVVTETSLENQLKANNFCHENRIPYVYAEVRGLFGNIFCDFGEGFIVVDPNGESPLSGIVAGIDTSGLVTALDETRHGFEDGDYVVFSEVQGMEDLNGIEFKVEVKGNKVPGSKNLSIIINSPRILQDLTHFPSVMFQHTAHTYVAGSLHKLKDLRSSTSNRKSSNSQNQSFSFPTMPNSTDLSSSTLDSKLFTNLLQSTRVCQGL